jgi:hypothetical protein
MDVINSSISANKPTSIEPIQTYTVLDNKRFRCMSRDLLVLLVEKLGGSALKVYLSLYDRAEFIRHQKKRALPIYVSYASLAKTVGKSAATVGRALLELRAKGFIKVFDQGRADDVYLPTKILVGLPQAVAQQMMKELPDRKNADATFVSIDPIDVDNPEDDSKEGKEAQLLKKYNAIYSQEKISLPPLKAASEAFKSFSAEEKKLIQELLAINESNLTTTVVSKLRGAQTKSEQHKDNNRKELLLTKGDPSLENNLSLKKKKFVRNKYFSSQEVETLEKKIRYLKKTNLVSGEAKGKTLSQVLSEIRFHVSYSELPFKHALNACCKLLKDGRWQTPRKMVFFDSIKREKQAKINKKQELHDFKFNFAAGIFQGDGA